MLPFSADTGIRWDEVKNQRLKKVRGVSFQEILKGKVIRIEVHPTRRRQNLLYIDYKQYVWLVPFVQQDKEVFLKTLYPSRKHTKLYRRTG